MKRVLIAGISGFIGRSLREYIESNIPSFEVYGIDVSVKKSSKRIFRCNLNNQKALKSIIQKISPHYVFHLAGSTTRGDVSSSFLTNILSTYNLLDVLHELKSIKPRVIIPGSAAEYGRVSQRDMPVKESYPLKPINFYGHMKTYQIILALSFCEKGLDVVVGRIFNAVGRGSPQRLVMGNLVNQIALIEKGKKKTITGVKSLTSKRDYIDVADVSSALVSLAKKGKKGEIYNICSGKSYNVKELLANLIKLSSCKKFAIKFSPKSFSEVKDIRGSNRKIKKDTGWSPKVDIVDSLKNALDYCRDNDDR